MTSPSIPTITVEIVSDAICPWCWIGKRRLEGAAAILDGKVAIETAWKPFELNPDMPKGGVERQAYRLRNFGSLDFSAQLDARVAEAGRSVGLDFRHDLMKWTPNTFDCHRLIWLAGCEGRQDEVVEGLFQAYFHDGRNIGDPGIMADVAEAAGSKRAEVEAFLASNAGADEVTRELAMKRAMGIEGVPTFFVNGTPLVSGAAPSELLARAIGEAAAQTVA